MIKLSLGQLKAASEITGQISVAWFVAGVITPLFTKQTGAVYLYNLLVSLFMAMIFSLIAILLVKKINYD